MTKESNFWSTVREHLSPFGALLRIENSAKDGTPDVAYCLRRPKLGSPPATGFIELKSLPEYPVRRSTPIRPPHLSKDQVLFAEEWAKAGGRAWLLLKAPPWILLFDPGGVRMLYEGKVAAMDGPAIAKVAGMGKFPTGPILRALTV